MPPENLAGFRERLATLEAQHKAMEDKHVTSVASLSERLDAHIEETERQFASVNASVTNTQGMVEQVATTMRDFISTHNAVEQTRDKQNVKAWQLWGIIAAVFLAPIISKVIDKIFGGLF